MKVILQDGTVQECSFNDEVGQEAFHHTPSHILAQAVKRLYPTTKCAIGPAIKDGFYYDFEFDFDFTDNMLHIHNDDIGVSISYQLSTKRFKNGNVKYANLVPALKSKSQLAFDHAEIILESMIKLRREIEYTDLPFSMVNEEFTLPDLQVIYELLLGHSLYKANFRIMVADRIEDVGRKEKSVVGRRLSELYRLK